MGVRVYSQGAEHYYPGADGFAVYGSVLIITQNIGAPPMYGDPTGLAPQRYIDGFPVNPIDAQRNVAAFSSFDRVELVEDEG